MTLTDVMHMKHLSLHHASVAHLSLKVSNFSLCPSWTVKSNSLNTRKGMPHKLILIVSMPVPLDKALSHGGLDRGVEGNLNREISSIIHSHTALRHVLHCVDCVSMHCVSLIGSI